MPCQRIAQHVPLPRPAAPRYISGEFPYTGARPSSRDLRRLGRVSRHSEAGRMARQFIYHMQGLTKTYPTTARCSRTSTCRSIRTPRSACSGSTARASRRCCGSWPGIDKEFTGEGWVGRRRARRLPAAGAAARSRQERARERDGGRRGQEGAARPLQRDRRQLFGRDRRRDGEAAGPDRQPRICGTSTPRSTWRWTRCAVRPTTPRWTSFPAARSAASRSASCCSTSPIFCCSTSRPTISTPRAWTGWKATCATIPARS